MDAQAGENPMKIGNKADFLKKYAGAFGRGYVEVSSAASTESEQVFNLIDSSKTIVGQAHFTVDSEGRVQALRFTQ